MREIRLPLTIVYETHAPVAVRDVIAALSSADAIAIDAASLLPSLIDGLIVERSSLNVRVLEEGSLREALFLALLVTYQDELSEEVPPMLESIFNVTVSDKYDTLATVAFLTVLFYGAGLAIDAAKRAFSDSLPRQSLEELIDVLARETGKPASDIRNKVEAKFRKPAAAKRLVKSAKEFFLPSQRQGNAPIRFDREQIPSELIREIPYPGLTDKDQDFDRYTPKYDVELELHAQDKGKRSTGWAAVVKEVSEERLKVRLVDPVRPSDLWQKELARADIVVVSKLTSDGYVPAEIQITSIRSAS